MPMEYVFTEISEIVGRFNEYIGPIATIMSINVGTIQSHISVSETYYTEYHNSRIQFRLTKWFLLYFLFPDNSIYDDHLHKIRINNVS